MASKGFEFAYMLDGGGGSPLIHDFTLGAAAAHKVGDLMKMQTDGYIDQVTTPTDEVTCIMMEAVTALAITAGTTKAKAAIITRNQVWRCSMNAATTAFVKGYPQTIDTVDCNTVSATDSSGGAMVLVDKGLDEDGNVMAYVVFLDTTFGNV